MIANKIASKKFKNFKCKFDFFSFYKQKHKQMVGSMIHKKISINQTKNQHLN